MEIKALKKIKEDKEFDRQRLLKERKLEEQAEFVKYLESQNDNQQDEIRGLKKTITTPSIDKLVEVMEHNNFSDFEEAITGLKNQIEHIERVAVQTEDRTCQINGAIDHMRYSGVRFR